MGIVHEIGNITFQVGFLLFTVENATVICLEPHQSGKQGVR